MKVTLTEDEARTVVGVFSVLESMEYGKLNTFLGSITIQDMVELCGKLRNELGLNVEQEEY